MIKDIIIHILKGRTGRKVPFGHTRRLEPQPRGAVTRRAVAQRRSRAQRLDSPLGVGYPGFWVGVLLSVRLSRFAAVRRKSFVFSSLSIRKVLVLSFRTVFPLEFSTVVAAPTTWVLLLVLYYLL